MTKADNDKLERQILRGLRKSYRKLVRTKRRNNGTLVVMRRGKIVAIKP